jgi:hypothetical protein
MKWELTAAKMVTISDSTERRFSAWHSAFAMMLGRLNVGSSCRNHVSELMTPKMRMNPDLQEMPTVGVW